MIWYNVSKSALYVLLKSSLEQHIVTVLIKICQDCMIWLQVSSSRVKDNNNLKITLRWFELHYLCGATKM